MSLFRIVAVAVLLLFTAATLILGQDEATKSQEASPAPSVSHKLAGDGVVNDSTIKAGQPVTVEVYMTNDTIRSGLSVGFRITSDDIEKIVHVGDSGNGMTDLGDLKAYNGFETKQYFDLNGLWINTSAWNGNLPDTIGIAGLNIKAEYPPHNKMKTLSFDIMVPTAGTIVIDSSFCQPGITWKTFKKVNRPRPDFPTWDGPYRITVVE